MCTIISANWTILSPLLKTDTPPEIHISLPLGIKSVSKQKYASNLREGDAHFRADANGTVYRNLPTHCAEYC